MKKAIGWLLSVGAIVALLSGVEGLERVAVAYVWMIIFAGLVYILLAVFGSKHKSMADMRAEARKPRSAARKVVSLTCLLGLSVLLAYQGFLVTAISYCLVGVFVRGANKVFADAYDKLDATTT